MHAEAKGRKEEGGDVEVAGVAEGRELVAAEALGDGVVEQTSGGDDEDEDQDVQVLPVPRGDAGVDGGGCPERGDRGEDCGTPAKAEAGLDTDEVAVGDGPSPGGLDLEQVLKQRPAVEAKGVHQP